MEDTEVKEMSLEEKVADIKDIIAAEPAGDESTMEVVNDEIEDAIVRADAEDEAHEQAAEKADSVDTPAPRRRRKIAEVTTKSEEILKEDSKKLSAEEQTLKTLNKLKSAQRTGEILEGTVFGVEPYGDGVDAVILWNDQRVMIRDDEYFMPDYSFGEAYPSMSKEDQIDRRRRVLSYQQGARVPFIVKGIERTKYVNPDGDSETILVVGASRKEAMNKMKEIHFFANINNRPQVGDLAEANVIAVREDRAVVECLGIETRIDAFNIADGYVENCQEFIKPGDTMPVRIRKLHIDEDTHRVYLTVSGRLNDASKHIVTIKQGSSYLGKVDHHNKASHVYTIRLANGVSASVHEENVIGGVILTPGDDVSVYVTKVLADEGFVRGGALKLH